MGIILLLFSSFFIERGILMSEFEKNNLQDDTNGNDIVEAEAQEQPVGNNDIKTDFPEIQSTVEAAPAEVTAPLQTAFEAKFDYSEYTEPSAPAYIPVNTADYSGEVFNQGKKMPLPLIIGVFILIAAIIGFALTFMFVPKVNNAVRAAVMKPADYYNYIQTKNYQSRNELISKAYGEYINQAKKQQLENSTVDVMTELSLDKDFSDEIGVTEFKSLDFNYRYSNFNDISKVDATLGLNGKDVTSAEIILDILNETAYVKAPDFSDAYLSSTFKDLNEKADGIYSRKASNDYAAKLIKLSEKEILTPEILEKLLNKYSEIFYSKINAVEIKKENLGSVKGLVYSYDLLEAKMTREEFQIIVLEVVKELKTDEEVKNIFVNLDICKEEEYADEIDKILKDLQDAMDDEEDSENDDAVKTDDSSVILSTWIDELGQVKGEEFGLSNNSKLGYLIVTEGNKSAVKAYLNTENVSSLGVDVLWEQTGEKITAEADMVSKELYYDEYESENNAKLNLIGETKDDKFSGVINVDMSSSFDEEDADEYTMQIDIKDFIRSGDFGIINGELNFSTSKYEKYKLNMLFNGEDKTQKLVWNLLKDDKKIVTMDQSMVYGNAAEEIKIPGGSDKVYNISDETEMEEYANSLSYTDFIEKFKEKFNIEALMKDAQAISENI